MAAHKVKKENCAMDERTNFERREDKMEFETSKPSALAEAQSVLGLNAEFTHPVVKHSENINEPLPNTGEGVHGENVSKPTPQTWQAPEAKPAKLGDYIARDKATDLAAQARGEISQLVDVQGLYREREEGQ
jgi:hypothetical protein